jgi:hypothetical protein
LFLAGDGKRVHMWNQLLTTPSIIVNGI